MNAPAIGLGAARFIGQRVPRKEDAAAADRPGHVRRRRRRCPACCTCAFVRSPIARGRILSIDMPAARDAAGRPRDLHRRGPRRCSIIEMLSFFSSTAASRPRCRRWRATASPMSAIRWRWSSPTDRYIAEDAAGLVESTMTRKSRSSPSPTPGTGRRSIPTPTATSPRRWAAEEDRRELEAVLRGAPHRRHRTITHQRIAQSPMETRGVVAVAAGRRGADGLHHLPEPAHGRALCSPGASACRTRASASSPRTSAARSASRTRPGARKWRSSPPALLLGRPLKWIEDRLENLTAANQAREQEMHAARRLRHGRQAARLARRLCSCNNGAYPHVADANVAAMMFMWAAYKLPAYGFNTRGWYTNTIGLAAYRGPWAMESLARETAARHRRAADRHRSDRDPPPQPVTAADQPTPPIMGMPLEDITPAECLEKLLDHLRRRRLPRGAGGGARSRGATSASASPPMSSRPATGSFAPMTGELAQIRIEPTGKVTAHAEHPFAGPRHRRRRWPRSSPTGSACRYEDVTVFEGDSSRGGFGAGRGGQPPGRDRRRRLDQAAEPCSDKVKLLAAHLLNASPETSASRTAWSTSRARRR